MKLKSTLVALVLAFSNLMASENYFNKGMNFAYHTFEDLSRFSNLNFQGFKIDIKQKKVNYSGYPNLYFLIREDHNGEPLYVLTYRFNPEYVQTHFKGLQRIIQRRAD